MTRFQPSDCLSAYKKEDAMSSSGSTFKILAVLLAIFMALVACGEEPATEDQIRDGDTQAEEEASAQAEAAQQREQEAHDDEVSWLSCGLKYADYGSAAGAALDEFSFSISRFRAAVDNLNDTHRQVESSDVRVHEPCESGVGQNLKNAHDFLQDALDTWESCLSSDVIDDGVGYCDEESMPFDSLMAVSNAQDAWAEAWGVIEENSPILQ